MTAVTKTYLTTKQVADRLGRSVSTVSRLVAAGQLTPVMRLEGLRGAMWFDPEEIDKFDPQQAAS